MQRVRKAVTKAWAVCVTTWLWRSCECEDQQEVESTNAQHVLSTWSDILHHSWSKPDEEQG
jgi:hypothetical protein